VVLDIKLVGGSGIEVLRKVRPDGAGHPVHRPHQQCRRSVSQGLHGGGSGHFLDKASEFEKVRDLISA
jgi:hypothetical protein